MCADAAPMAPIALGASGLGTGEEPDGKDGYEHQGNHVFLRIQRSAQLIEAVPKSLWHAAGAYRNGRKQSHETKDEC